MIAHTVLNVDFPLSSSVILVVAVALWIVWVAPYVLRNGGQRLLPASELISDVVDVETADPQAGTVMKMAAQQERPMDTVPSTESGRADSGRGSSPRGPGREHAAAGRTAFKIRYGRCAIALLGLAGLLVAITSGVLRLFSIGPVWLPVASLAATVSAVALLRWLAVRARRAKVQAAFRSAMGSTPGPRVSSGRETEQRPVRPQEKASADVPLFDAEAARPQVKPFTAVELRQAALAEAAASGDHSVRPAWTAVSGTDATWEPVEVPKPTYVEAAKAERAAPEPLQLPESPKAAGKPVLKQGPAAAPAATAPQTKPLTKAQSALSNLDDVLQRRRA